MQKCTIYIPCITYDVMSLNNGGGRKATPLDTKFFHSNGVNQNLCCSCGSDGPFYTERFDTVPALSMDSFYIMSTGINDVHLWRYLSILDMLCCIMPFSLQIHGAIFDLGG